MKLTGLLAFAAIGTAVGLLLYTEKGKELRKTAADNATDWSKKLNKLLAKKGNELADLKDKLTDEIEGLSSDARKKILDILEEGDKTAHTVKRMKNLA